MSDPTLSELTALVTRFRDEREWRQFHNPKDMAISLCLEAAELLEHTQWRGGKDLEKYLEANRGPVGEELSDVLYWVLLLAHDLQIDLGAAFRAKMAANAAKYPVERARGSRRKYDEL